MNKVWSEKCKLSLDLLSKAATFEEGKKSLLELREILFAELLRFQTVCSQEDFSKQPFLNAKGYHKATLAYSIWHVFRIEDIVAHTLIKGDDQVLFTGDWQKKIGSPIITTANEIHGEDYVTFSKQLDVNQLYEYIKAVKESTDEIIRSLDYAAGKCKVSAERRKAAEESGCVSSSPDAWWLIDYWCGKTNTGLLKMPFSRHWIMHIEAMNRIAAKIEK